MTNISINRLRALIREELQNSMVSEDAEPRLEREANAERVADAAAENVELAKAAMKLKDTMTKAREGIQGHLAAALESAGFDFKSLIALLDDINSHPGNYTASRPVASDVVEQDPRGPAKGPNAPRPRV
jgi:hypothetical protein